MHNILKHIKAFTLVELMVGIVLMSLVTVLMTPVVSKKLKSSQIMVNADQVRVPPGCNEFSPDCKMCYPHECIFCEDKGCGEIDTQYGKTSTVLVKELCKCRLCNSDKDAAFKAGAINYDVQNTVTSDKHCYKCTLNKKTCDECMPGYFLNASKKCEICPEKHYCSDGKTKNECTPGYYQPNKGQTACIECPAGKYQNKYGQTACIDCAKGTYQNKTGKTTCDNCNNGRFQDKPGQSDCQNCSAKYYSPSTGAIENCLPCNNGKFQDEPMKSACKDCSSGYYTPKTGAYSDCSPCNNGQYQYGTIKYTCKNCSAGYYTPKTGAYASCSVCPPGTTSGEKAYECKPCPAGQTSSAGSSTCSNCEAGKYSTPGGTCQCCKRGTYAVGNPATGCETCSPGTYQPSDCKTSCSPCPYPNTSECDAITGDIISCVSGYVKISKTQCSNCGAGSYIVNGVCKPCGAGTYSTKAGSTSCAICQAGTYSKEGATSCTPCPVGKYQPNPGKSDCIPCPANTYASTTGATSCANCPSGKFSARGASSCSNCSANCRTCTSATNCTNCSKGKIFDGRCTGPVKQADCDPYNAYYVSATIDNKSFKACITKFNAGENKGPALPRTVGLINAGTKCNTSKYGSKCCWKGTTGTEEAQGGISRPVCTPDAGKEICSNWSAGNGNWRLLKKAEINLAKVKNSSKANLRFCGYLFGNWDCCSNSSTIPANMKDCYLNASYKYCGPHRMQTAGGYVNVAGKNSWQYFDDSNWGSGSGYSSTSIRCVSEDVPLTD